jgi:integrase
MKNRFWLFCRGKVFYLEDSVTGKKESLKTTDRKTAERLRLARNEVAEKPHIGLALGRAYLSALEPKVATRTWQLVMEEFCQKGKESSRVRRQRAVKSPAFNSLRKKLLIETTQDDLRVVLADKKTSTHHFLRCLHNLAVGLGWLPWPIMPAKLWPVMHPKKKRGVTASEHQRIIQAEGDAEKRMLYGLLWEIGAAQSDAAMLVSEDIDWGRRVLSYRRQKTDEWAHLVVGERLEQLLRKLPAQGPLFPHQRTLTASARSAEFRRRCRTLKITGISLHSYRYAWAERAKVAGYPERWAQNALGHNSRAVHEAYARGGEAVCPALEDYERKLSSLRARAQPG